MGIISLIACIITAYLAKKKGYNPVLWFFAAGIPGLLIFAFLPYTNKGNLSEEERLKKVKKGNTIGGVLIAIAIIFIMFYKFILFPVQQEKKIREFIKETRVLIKKTDRNMCKMQAQEIIRALEEYYNSHHDIPNSLHNADFVNHYLNSKLPKHPLGWDWDDYYHPENPDQLDWGYGYVTDVDDYYSEKPAPIDIKKACNF